MNKLQWNKKVVNVLNDNNDIKFNLAHHDMVVLNYFCDNQQNININIVQTYNTYFVLNLTGIINEACTINIINNISGNNNTSIINVRALGNADAIINVEVKVSDGTANNKTIQNLKGINENGSLTILPIFEIDTNNVDAEHFVTVGPYDKNTLFYLQSKGISLESAYKLLQKSFLYSLFSDEFLEIINKKGD